MFNLTGYVAKAKNGDADAQCIIGAYYLFEKNDFLTGLYWLKRSAEQMHEKACQTLYAIYNEGYIVKKDTATAGKWLLRSRLNFYKTEYNKAFGDFFK